MRREKYVYNEATLQFEKVERKGHQLALHALTFVSGAFILGLIAFFIADHYIDTPSKVALKRDISQMTLYMESMDEEIDLLSKVLENVQERDAHVHRALFGMNPIDEDLWNSGTGGHDQYAHMERYGNFGSVLIQSQMKLDQLKRQTYLQTQSLDTLQKKAREREDMISSIPSIKPVRLDLLKRGLNHLSGFGIRLHPVHKVKKMHQGIDFTAPRGTPIQATGDGKVVKVSKKRTGYGRHVVIDHGFGYKTLYAHMKDVTVSKGDIVKKGQQIGTVGSTGTSTAPHCHYEVRFNDKPVNPIHYVMDGLTPEEYQSLVERASKANQSFD
jgi:hypothetical protein